MQAEPVYRRPRLVDDLPGDQPEQGDRGEGGGQREAVQGRVPGMEAPAPPDLGGAGGGRLGDCRQLWTRFRVFSEAPSTFLGIGTKRSLGPYCWPAVSAQKTNFFRSAALFEFSGRITYVKVQIG